MEINVIIPRRINKVLKSMIKDNREKSKLPITKTDVKPNKNVVTEEI